MPIDRHPRRGKTPEEIAIEQRRQAEILRDQQRQQQAERSSHQANVSPDVMPPASVPAKATPTVPATNAIDTRTTHQRYLDSVSPTAIVGRLIRFSKDGVFVTSDDEQPVDGDTNFYGLCDEVQIGWIKYAQEEGGETQRVAGLLYDDYELQERSSLGDDDETRWPVGLGGTTPEDPWKHFQNLVLERVDTREMFTFSTASKTGRRSVGNLLRHYDRLQRAHPGDVPIVRLRPAASIIPIHASDWVATPMFCVVGHAPRNSAATPDTSAGGDMNDEIPV